MVGALLVGFLLFASYNFRNVGHCFARQHLQPQVLYHSRNLFSKISFFFRGGVPGGGVSAGVVSPAQTNGQKDRQTEFPLVNSTPSVEVVE